MPGRYMMKAENITLHYYYDYTEKTNDLSIIRFTRTLKETELKYLTISCILSDVSESQSVNFYF